MLCIEGIQYAGSNVAVAVGVIGVLIKLLVGDTSSGAVLQLNRIAKQIKTLIKNFGFSN